MRSFDGRERGMGCDLEEHARALVEPGPFRDFRNALWNPRWNPAPFERHELTYVAFALPKGTPWTAEVLAGAFDEVVEFSLRPDLARSFVDARLSNPFSGWMSDRAEAFRAEMGDFFEDVFEIPAPGRERAVVLTAVFLRLYDAAVEANVVSAPTPRTIRVISTRGAT